MDDEPPFTPDPLRLDFTRPETKELIGLLAQEVPARSQITELMKRAGISPGEINLEQAARWIWNEVLTYAGTAGRLRRLLTVVVKDDRYFAVHNHAQRVLDGKKIAVEAPSPGSAALRKGGWRGGQEAQTAQRSGLVDIGFLAGGVRAARSVFRIGVEKETGLVHGTGFLIGPKRILSNFHVLCEQDGRPGRLVTLHAGHELGEDGREQTGRALHGKDSTIVGEPELDWAVVDLEEAPENGVILPFAKEAPRVGDYVSIIQHPFGGMKKIALFNNEVRFIDGPIVQYLTDTESGSSGSPVLNTRWEVVALHHAWVPSEGERRMVRNEGILIGRVAAALQAQGLMEP